MDGRAPKRLEDRGHHIAAMNHVEVTRTIALQPRFAAQELSQPITAARPVNAGQPHDDDREFQFLERGKKQILRFDQRQRRFRHRRHGVGFDDERAVFLAIDAGAAGENVFARRRSAQPVNQV